MSKASGGVVGPGAYQVGAEPYRLSAVSGQALQELARRGRRKQAPAAPKAADPELSAAKQEAALIRKEAASRLEAAQAQAAEIRRAAEAELESLKQQAREEGYAQGLSQGTEQGYDEGLKKGEDEGMGRWAELVARWQGLLDATLKEKENYLADRERVLVDLVMRVAAKVLAREVKLRPEEIQVRVAEAIKRANQRANLVVRLHPEDLAKAMEAESAALRSAQGVKQIEYLADERVMRGGLRVESASETIDAGMDTQLAEIIKALLQEAYHAG